MKLGIFLLTLVPFFCAHADHNFTEIQRLALDEAIQDEYRAYETYTKMILTFGTITPFSNIRSAEARHIEELKSLYIPLGLVVPKSKWHQQNVPSYNTVLAACEAGIKSEEENIAMYDRLLKKRLSDEVAATFQRLRRASLENHLPAFENCVDRYVD